MELPNTIFKDGVKIALSLVILIQIASHVAGTGAIDIYQPVNYVICMIYWALWDIASALAALVFVFSGVRYIASMDDPGKRKASKDTMIHALIGLLIITIAESIITSISTPLGLPGPKCPEALK